MIALTLNQALNFSLTMLPIVAGAVIAAWRYRALASNLRPLAWLTWFELPLEILAIVLELQQRNNLFIMPLYTVGELTLLAVLYRRTLRQAAFGRLVTWLVGGFAAYTLFDSLLAQDLLWYRPGQQIIQSLLLLSMAGLYFRQLLNELQVIRLSREPVFWVSIGLVLYFVGYLNIALFSNYMLRHYSMQFNQNIWTINSGLATVLHGCYCVALALRQPARRG